MKLIKTLDELKLLSKNKQIIWADNEFKLVFKTIIQKALLNYKGIPLEWEDVYYEFLYYVPKWIVKFDENKKIKLKTFLGIQCNFFTSNECRKYSSNKYKILNEFISYDKSPIPSRLSDAYKLEVMIDISKLSEIEVLIYNDFILDGESIASIYRKRGISKYKIGKLIESIKSKLLLQIKN